ncbi:EutN/CcmL family microcompartment protein [Candidatus Hydrogenedentota bacterium]
MFIGKVVGTVVSTAKSERLEQLKLLVVQQLDTEVNFTGVYVVAVDTVGSGVGEVVLYSLGSSARQTDLTHNKPVDAVISAIIDSWDIEGVVKFRKDD